MDANGLDPTIATYDRIAARFAAQHFADASDVLVEARAAFARAIVGQAPPERFRILDAGCGPGRDAQWFRERGFQTIGVDLSAGMLAEARRRVPGVDFRQADLRHLDFPDGYFDGIWCAAALLHLSRADVPSVLASFHRLLGHGFLWLSLKAGEGEVITSAPYGAENPRRFTYFSRTEIELLLERAGFDVHRVDEEARSPGPSHPWLSILAQTKLRTPLLATIAILFDEAGRVLLSERADGLGWNPPAGFVEAEESPEEAVVRETKEETGLDVVVERLIWIATSPRIRRGPGPPVSGNLITHGFLCRVVGGSLVPTTEALQHGWFPIEALPAPLSSRRHADLIQVAVEAKKGNLAWPEVRRYGR